MTSPFVPPPPKVVREIRALAERRLPREEFDAYANAPMSEEERAEKHELIEWFTRHYPTPLQRLASARRAYVNVKRWIPPDE
jgi:hypothetical protein